MEKTNLLLGSYGISVALLAAAAFFAKAVNGANGWIFGIQPAEFVKITVILVLAHFCEEARNKYVCFKGSGPVLLGVGLIMF